MYIGILWQVKIGDKVWGSLVDAAIALAMAVKKARLSQELHPKDVRESSQGKNLAVWQHTKNGSHILTRPTQDMHHKAHSGSTNPHKPEL